MFYLMKIVDRFDPVVIFLFALTPLPDDMLFIPLGILRYSFLKAFVPCLIGKFAMAFIIAYSGKVSFELIRLIFGGSDWVVTILMLVLLAISVVVMFRINWEEIFKKYLEKKE